MTDDIHWEDRPEKNGPWLVHSRLWAKLKPLARQMRHDDTKAEAYLWEFLRAKRLNSLKFRRQHSVGQFIVDFYCPRSKLVVEVDGEIHEQQIERDAARTVYLQARGLRVLRFSNAQVFDETERVLTEIYEAATDNPTSESPSL